MRGKRIPLFAAQLTAGLAMANGDAHEKEKPVCCFVWLAFALVLAQMASLSDIMLGDGKRKAVRRFRLHERNQSHLRVEKICTTYNTNTYT